jgi:dTDP-4-amino-4,6-dideoxygalactose transaminase
MFIDFNKPYFSGNELNYIQDAIALRKISGNGKYTQRCHKFFEKKYGFKKCLLTNSCTDALEMAAILLNIEGGDEVIMPSYTFVSTANAFVLRGAKIVFADSRADHPGIDEDGVENLITSKTKAIVVVHYAGIACDMDKIMAIAKRHHLYVVEDAAQAIDSFYKDRPLGGIGHLSAFSFHETKNIISGEGGMLVINDKQFEERAEIIWEKGTNRSAFFRGEVDKYGWVDIGSSFLPSEITAAFLYAQLENLEVIQTRRKQLWSTYYDLLKDKASQFTVPRVPDYSSNNAHLFYLTCNSLDIRNQLIRKCQENNVHTFFHYQSLHKSPFYQAKHDGRELPNCDRYSDCLVRLPMYFDLQLGEISQITEIISGLIID